MTVTLEFLGANRQVTGSKHLLTVNGRRILLDCGMVQGPRRLADRLNRNLPLAPSKVDAVVLSHAHIDHSGSLPRLVKLGFKGPIYCTDATKDLLGILLPDSAHIQSSDARYLRKHGRSFEPAYDMEDVDRTMKRTEGLPYRTKTRICPEVEVTFLDAGHILGSAQVILDIQDGSHSLRLAFTGDLGRPNTPILRDPDPLPRCDVLITESTYGNRIHAKTKDLGQQITRLIEEQSEQGGRILIPAFSIGRTQNLLWFLGRLIKDGTIPPIPIYIDSPLSTKATAIVAKHSELFDRETAALLNEGHDPFFFDGVHFTADVEESKRLNGLRHGIIISASGMCEGGRILHHLKQTIGRPEDVVWVVGFQAQGTLGRKLLEDYAMVKIYGERFEVQCRVRYIDGLSAHADCKELLDHLSPIASTTRQAFVVHGEENASMQFADRLLDVGFPSVEVPLHKETFTLIP